MRGDNFTEWKAGEETVLMQQILEARKEENKARIVANKLKFSFAFADFADRGKDEAAALNAKTVKEDWEEAIKVHKKAVYDLTVLYAILGCERVDEIIKNTTHQNKT